MQIKKYLETTSNQNFFAKEWKRLENKQNFPSVYRKLVFVDYEEFASKIIEQDSKFVKETVNNLYSGDMYILKNSIKKKKLNILLMRFINLLSPAHQVSIRCWRVSQIFIDGLAKIS